MRLAVRLTEPAQEIKSEAGAIQCPVEEITITGNLKDMFRGLAAVGNDVDRTGSILIESMTLAGS
ncbi:MAG TPA: metallopeptidase TldD-related protein [Acidiferrobacterales bacterium]|nr:metallopeptidase TldD-related protein [Acidiferrobacterales bacterium]